VLLRTSRGFDLGLSLRWMGRLTLSVGLGGMCVCILISAGLAQAPSASASKGQTIGVAENTLEAQVDSLLRGITLEEKIGQLVQYSAGQPTGPGAGRTDYEDMIAHGQISSLFNVIDPHQINAYQRIAMEKSRLHIPILFGLDVIHGFKTEFPIPLALASSWDPSIVEKESHIAAMEASADGIRWTFSPMVDIARDARWGRMAEGAGEDPFLGSAMAAAYVRGYQGSRLDAPDRIASCAKHYVGYGAAESGRDYNSTEISEHFRARIPGARRDCAIIKDSLGMREISKYQLPSQRLGNFKLVRNSSPSNIGVPQLGQPRDRGQCLRGDPRSENIERFKLAQIRNPI
jgi:hypothetical protein